MFDVFKSDVIRKLHSIVEPADDTQIVGVFIFGSVARGVNRKDSDLDMALVFSGTPPRLKKVEKIDLFCWSLEKWRRGFPLQLAIMEDAMILSDPEGEIRKKFETLRNTIHPKITNLLRNDFP